MNYKLIHIFVTVTVIVTVTVTVTVKREFWNCFDYPGLEYSVILLGVKGPTEERMEKANIVEKVAEGFFLQSLKD